MFAGNQLKDEFGFAAVFSEQGSSSSHMCAANFLDAIARMPGNDGNDADARAAYTQAELQEEDNTETWVRLADECRPANWGNQYRDPVVRLRLALEGHPRAGFYWEHHCRKAVLSAGFEPVKGWESMYKHYKWQLFLSIYVDDFKMAGRKKT